MDEIMELGLSKRRRSDSDDALVKLVWLVDQLLTLISENTWEGESPKSLEFRSQLEESRGEIRGVTGNEIAESLARECLELCDNQFKRSEIQRLERDEKFAEVIHVLREALTGLAGDAQEFNASLVGSSNRISRLTEIKDIQELRKRIAGEVGELRRVVSEKQKKDEIAHSQLSDRIAIQIGRAHV